MWKSVCKAYQFSASIIVVFFSTARINMNTSFFLLASSTHLSSNWNFDSINYRLTSTSFNLNIDKKILQHGDTGNAHDDLIHDAVLDYYGKRLATCSSDKTIKIFDLDGTDNYKLITTLTGHEGPVWQVSWHILNLGQYWLRARMMGRH